MSVHSLGPFCILKTIGRGTYASVHLARHVQTDQEVAIKIFSSNGDTHSISELNALLTLRHPHVVNVLEVIDLDHDSSQAIVLELCLGDFFVNLQKCGKFQEELARTYFKQLVEGLEHCHEMGIAHRDLKPENLLVAQDFSLKIADFGFAKKLSSDRNGFMNTQCRSDFYRAPEVWSAMPYCAKKSDVFSLGVILFLFLAAFPPLKFALRSDWWFQKLMTKDYKKFWDAHERMAFFSESAKELLERLLEPIPEKRIALHEIKQHAWMDGPTLCSDSLVEIMKNRHDILKTLVFPSC